ncbi:MAG: hypothetical protein AMS22_08825 [Thiotrichales bacterium SG8_50]|nr:MAG: hypothetical protein AMS22_08825 [Thiotrichales bacterium SG8_50]
MHRPHRPDPYLPVPDQIRLDIRLDQHRIRPHQCHFENQADRHHMRQVARRHRRSPNRPRQDRHRRRRRLRRHLRRCQHQKDTRRRSPAQDRCPS